MKACAIIVFVALIAACSNCARNPETANTDHPGQPLAIQAPDKYNIYRNSPEIANRLKILENGVSRMLRRRSSGIDERADVCFRRGHVIGFV
jgi:hypothetical protein